MKITSIEVKMIFLVIVLAGCTLLFSWQIAKEIEKRGGIKGLIIEAGKEIKDIKRQINE